MGWFSCGMGKCMSSSSSVSGGGGRGGMVSDGNGGRGGPSVTHGSRNKWTFSALVYVWPYNNAINTKAILWLKRRHNDEDMRITMPMEMIKWRCNMIENVTSNHCFFRTSIVHRKSFKKDTNLNFTYIYHRCKD